MAEASNGRDAIELASRLHPDVIVMDIGMSGLNGVGATLAATPRVMDRSLH